MRSREEVEGQIVGWNGAEDGERNAMSQAALQVELLLDIRELLLEAREERKFEGQRIVMQELHAPCPICHAAPGTPCDREVRHG